MTERTVHLLSGYTMSRGKLRRRMWRRYLRHIPLIGRLWRRNWSEPSPACRGRDIRKRDMISIYDSPELESSVTCQQCLEWLNEPKGMHRLMVTKGGIDEYLRRMIKEQPGELRYMDIPSGETGIVESEDDLPGGNQ